ncbi:MAG: hypothetical protein IPM59_15350 [Chloracidobacterium sp.]|nr:hypothetical protein [Chloracidobacterium sp.]
MAGWSGLRASTPTKALMSKARSSSFTAKDGHGRIVPRTRQRAWTDDDLNGVKGTDWADPITYAEAHGCRYDPYRITPDTGILAPASQLYRPRLYISGETSRYANQ